MSAPLGRREFFVLEAGEYLERLSTLAAASGSPDGDQLVRYARALRGAALMAGPPGYSSAAAAIESLARRHREGTIAWTPALADRLTRALDDCKALLRTVREWGDPELSRCERLARAIDSLAGTESRLVPGTPQAAGTATITAGVRAFVARESAAVAAALEHTAEEVERRPSPTSAAPLLQRLQPLRGLGALPGLSPLPELLEALDLTLAAGGRGGAWPPGSGRALRAAGAALSQMARDIAELGMPQVDSHTVVQAADLLRESFAGNDDVVPIARLFPEGDRQPILARGTTPPPPSPPGDPTVELVSLADRLRMAADQMAEPAGWAARALMLHVLALALRGLPMSPSLRTGAGIFLAKIDREIMAGRAARQPERVADLLRRAADALVDAVDADSPDRLSEALRPLGEALEAMGGPLAVAPAAVAQDVVPVGTLAPADAAPAAVEEPAVVPIESLAPSGAVPVAVEEPDVVPIETLAPGDAAPVAVEEPVAIEEPAGVGAPAPYPAEAVSTGPPGPDETVVPIGTLLADARSAGRPALTPFEQTFSTYFRLLRGETADVVPIESLAYAAEPVPPISDAGIVPIGGLLYRGRRALERADTVRAELARALKARRDLSGVESLLAELLDLVPLALADDR